MTYATATWIVSSASLPLPQAARSLTVRFAERSKNRPMVTGAVTVRSALPLFIALVASYMWMVTWTGLGRDV